jgi:transposase
VAAPAPDHAMPAAAPGLLAHIVVSKYDDHLPLYRQAEIFARDGVSLETSPCPTGSALQRRRCRRSSKTSPPTSSPAMPTAHRPRCRLSRGPRPPGHRRRS